jgi:ComF family protein
MNLLDLLFPKTCLECGKKGSYICNNCASKVLDGTFGKNNFAIFKYKGVIRKAITSIKYKFATDIVDELVNICVNRLKSTKFHSIYLIPIPLYRQRENWRGFNQAEVIGKKLCQKMNWKFVPDLLIRIKETKPQVDLKGLDRQKNLSGVFGVNQPCKLKILNDEPILLFDDVYTTGSTINEARKVLKDAGFENIYSLTIAR